MAKLDLMNYKFLNKFLLLALLMLLLCGYQVYNSYQVARESAKINVQNLSLVLQRDMASSLQNSEHIATSIAAAIPVEALHREVVPHYRCQVTQLIKSSSIDFRLTEGIRIFDATGDLLYSDIDGEPGFNIVDRPFFQQLKNDPALASVYSDTIVSRASGRELIIRAKALRDNKGIFLGIVNVAIDVSTFINHLAKINIGSEGMVALLRLDRNTQLFRVPVSTKNNNELEADWAIRQAILGGTPSGNLEATGGGLRSIIGYQSLGKQLPFFVTVSQSEKDYLAQWRRDTLKLILAASFVLLIMGITFIQLARVESQRLTSTQQAQAKGEMLRTLYELSPLGIGLNDLSGRFVELNDALANICGYSVAEMLALDYRAITPESYQSAEAAQLEILLRTGRYGPYEKEYIHKDGRRVPVRLNGILLTSSSGEQLIWSIVEDMTRDKLMATQLQFQHDFKQEILDSLDGNIAVLDREGVIRSVNQPWIRFATLENGEMAPDTGIGTNYLAVCSRSALGRDSLAGIQSVLDGQRTEYRMEYPCDSPTGKRWFQMSVRPLGINARNGVVIMHSDITKRWLTEGQLRMFAFALEQTPVSIVITNLVPEIEYVNDAFTQASGFSRDEVINQNPRLMKSGRTPPETYVALWQSLRQEKVWTGELYNQRRDGSEFIELVTISPLRDPVGNVSHYVAIKQDITVQKTTEQALLSAQLAAEAANIAKSRFLAIMSHELRTPLNGMLGMAQVLMQPQLSDTDRLQYADTFLSSGNNLLMLLNDILDISKIEAGKIELECIAYSPALILDEVQNCYAESLLNHNVRLEIRTLFSREQQYLGDAHRLRQMLNNLVSNALKFTSNGMVLIEGREISRDKETALLKFAITDSGIGIAEDQLARLFKPFTQLDNSITRQFGGTGLGLSIVKNFAQQMGGEVGVSSEPGKGSRFWFTLKALVVEHALESPAYTMVDDSRQLSGRVLLVEDSEVSRTVVAAMLKKMAIVLHLAENGLEAFDRIRQGAPVDLVLMDVQMPVMNGYVATRNIREWEADNQAPRLPIIALTADAYADNRQSCLEAGMDDFMTKPIFIEQLMETLARWLPAVQTQRANSQSGSAPPDSVTPTVMPIFDEKSVLKQLGNDLEIARTVVTASKRELGIGFEKLQQAVESGALENTLRLVHTLKAMAAQAGGSQLAPLLQVLDKKLKDGGTLDSETLSDLQVKHHLLDTKLQEWLALPGGVPIEGSTQAQAATIYGELEVMLLKNEFGAIRQFRKLQGAVISEQVAAQLSAIAPLLDELNFAVVLEHLMPIALTVGWKDKTT